jgi:hypothetical protein
MLAIAEGHYRDPESSWMASFGVGILGAAEVAASRPRGRLQRPPLRLQHSRFAGEEGTLVHRRGRRRAGIRRAGIGYARSTDSERDGEPETGGYDSTPCGIQLGPHCGAPPFTALYTSIQSLDGFTGSTSAPASRSPVRPARYGQGAAHPGGTLVAAILKCHANGATGKLADDTAEDPCEQTAGTKFAATKTTGCAPCTGVLTGGTIEPLVDGANSAVYCTTAGTPFGGMTPVRSRRTSRRSP